MTKGEKASKVLTESDVFEILRLRSLGMKYKDISAKINRPIGTIQSILNGNRWNHITHIKPL